MGQAIGNALGLGTKFMGRDEVRQNYPYEDGLSLYDQIIQDGHRRDGEKVIGQTSRI